MKIVFKSLRSCHGKEGSDLSRCHDQCIRALWEWLRADTKTTAPYSTDRSGSWWPHEVCRALCDTVSASGYSKTNYRRKSSIRWNSIICMIPFRLDTPSFSVLCRDVNQFLLLPTRNTRLTLTGRRAGENGLPALWRPMVWTNRLDCSEPWKMACNGDKSLEKRWESLVVKWTAVEF